jgi:hypothetical protein
MTEPKYRVGDIVTVQVRGKITEVQNGAGGPWYWVETVRLGDVYEMELNLIFKGRPGEPCANAQ